MLTHDNLRYKTQAISGTQSYCIRGAREIKMTSALSSLEVKPATFEKHLHPPTSGLELDLFKTGLELDRIIIGLEPVSSDDGPETTPAEFYEQNGPQVLIGTEDKEVVEGGSPVGLTVQEPNEDLPRKKSPYGWVIALILFVILIAIIVSVSVMQTRESSR